MQFKPNYKAPFTKFVKKQHAPLQAVIQDEVEKVCEDPDIGQGKDGDLVNIRVHKFKHKKQEYLIAYHVPSLVESSAPVVEADKAKAEIEAVDDVEIEVEDDIKHRTPEFLLIDFYKIGSHENFYNDLKAYLRTNGWYK